MLLSAYLESVATASRRAGRWWVWAALVVHMGLARPALAAAPSSTGARASGEAVVSSPATGAKPAPPPQAAGVPGEHEPCPGDTPALAESLLRVVSLLQQPGSSCSGAQASRDLAVLEGSATAEGVYAAGRCLELRGDLLGARAAWQRVTSGQLCRLRPSSDYQAAARKRLESVDPPTLEVPFQLPEGARLTLHGSGDGASCQAEPGCGLVPPVTGLPLNPGTYTLRVQAPGAQRGAVEEVASYELGPGARGVASEEPLLPLLALWGLCEDLANREPSLAADLAASCFAAGGRYYEADEAWQRFLQEAERLGSGISLSRVSAARAARASLPALRVTGADYEGARLQIRGHGELDARASCAERVCNATVPATVVLSRGTYAVVVLDEAGAPQQSRRARVGLDPIEVKLALPPTPAYVWWRRGAAATLGVSAIPAGVTLLRYLDCGKSCSSGWARATDWIWLAAAAQAAGAAWLWWEEDPQPTVGPGVAAGCAADGCGLWVTQAF